MSDLVFHSGNFIYQNYQQALDKIATESQQLAALSAKLKTTPADYEGYIQAECEHLQSLKEEPVEVQRSIDYLEVLLKLAEAKYVSIFLLSILPLLNEVDLGKNPIKQLLSSRDLTSISFTMVTLASRSWLSRLVIVPRLPVGKSKKRHLPVLRNNMRLQHAGPLTVMHTRQLKPCLSKGAIAVQ